MRPGTIHWLNAGIWEEAPEFVVGHPDDTAYLAGLRSPGYVANRVTMGLGAYYGHELLRPGLSPTCEPRAAGPPAAPGLAFDPVPILQYRTRGSRVP